MSYSRRKFLLEVARCGGSVFGAMTALDLFAQDNGATWLPKDLPRLDKPRSVLILGAGAAGLSAAHELGKLGYRCKVLEARDRPGGRIWTIRRGVKDTEISGQTQTCAFDEGHYYNAGPARIPQHHYTTLGYCRDFGVAVEVFNNYNESAYIHSAKSERKVRIREARADFEGRTGELLAKAISADQLDAPLTKEDKEKLLEALRINTGLNPDLVYASHSSRGYGEWPAAAGQPGKLTSPDDLKTVVNTGFARALSQAESITQQPVMFQPVGGIDALPFAMAATLKGVITYGAEVTAIRKSASGGARVEYTHKGEKQVAEADYCLCTIAASVLRKIPADFASAYVQALGQIEYGASNKIGLQFRRRFWNRTTGSTAESAGPISRSGRCGIRITATSPRRASSLVTTPAIPATSRAAWILRPAHRRNAPSTRLPAARRSTRSIAPSSRMHSPCRGRRSATTKARMPAMNRPPCAHGS